MSTPAPLKIALVLAIPVLHIYLAQAFDIDLSIIPNIIIVSLKFLLISYVSWIVKEPVLKRLFAVFGVEEFQALSAMRMADNLHLLSNVGIYLAVVYSQKPWNEGYIILMWFTGAMILPSVVALNVEHDALYEEIKKKRQEEESRSDDVVESEKA